MKTINHRKDIRVSKDLVVRLTVRGRELYCSGKAEGSTGRIIPGCTVKHRLPAIEIQIPDTERIIVKKVEEKYKKITQPPKQKEVINIEKVYKKAPKHNVFKAFGLVEMRGIEPPTS